MVAIKRDARVKKYRHSPHSKKWEEAANDLARSYAPEIIPCRHCSGPVVEGYCCMHCGSNDPR